MKSGTAGLARWFVGTDAANESGSSAQVGFTIQRYGDTVTTLVRYLHQPQRRLGDLH
jgi:hypothetical protein